MAHHIVQDFAAIPETLAQCVRALSDDELDRVEPASGMSVRQLVHHLAEAQVVAASIVIAGMGSPSATYDWSWMMPFGPWMDRVPYRTLPIGVSLDCLRALNAWVVAVVGAVDGALEREVRLVDAPNADPHTATIETVLQQELEHATEHITGIQAHLAGRQGDGS